MERGNRGSGENMMPPQVLVGPCLQLYIYVLPTHIIMSMTKMVHNKKSNYNTSDA